jgi:hypothetical protein
MGETKLEKLARLPGKATSKALDALGNAGSISVGSCPPRSAEYRAGLLPRTQNRASDGRPQHDLQLAATR